MGEPVQDIRMSKDTDLIELFQMMRRSGGFMAVNLAVAKEILIEMFRKPDCLRILSFTGNLMATGLRGILRDMVRRRLFDLVITTCATLDHDLARSRANYECGTFDADDYELRKEGIHRLGNVLIRQSSYGEVIEREIRELMRKISDANYISTHEFCWRLGEHINNEESFLYWCWREKIPVIVPGIIDGAVGFHAWLNSQQRKFYFDLMSDEALLSDKFWNASTAGALIIGGGISKHHTLWWGQFSGEGLEYAVYITTATEYDGSLSGARPREAVSWKKLSASARHVFVNADATIALPFLYLAVIKSLD
ncbi:MAG: deoxyhypusine synthase [Nitrososphaerota archaeon]